MKNTKDMYYVSYQEIPVTLVNSFVVMEDRQFYKHSGYDIKAILRAIVINQKSMILRRGKYHYPAACTKYFPVAGSDMAA